MTTQEIREHLAERGFSPADEFSSVWQKDGASYAVSRLELIAKSPEDLDTYLEPLSASEQIWLEPEEDECESI